MRYGFDTEDEHAATAALLVYATWRSRDVTRFKITPDVWSQVERFVKASAKRAETVPQFLELLKPRLACGTLAPRAMEAGIKPELLVQTGSGAVLHVATPDEHREFMTGLIERANHKAVIRKLYGETAHCVLLVRERIERERPLEAKVQAFVHATGDEEEE